MKNKENVKDEKVLETKETSSVENTVDTVEINEPVTVKFISKYQKHRLVMKPARTIMQDGFVYPVPGKAIEFSDYKYETVNVEEISFLRKHRLFGVDIFEDKAGE